MTGLIIRNHPAEHKRKAVTMCPMVQRHETRTAWVAKIPIGSCHPIAVQSMTNTDTADVASTVAQVIQLSEAGSELVRVTVNTEKAAQAVPKIVRQLQDRGYDLPIIGDFHYNGHKLLVRFPGCARALAKYRINPGNVGKGRRRDENFKQMIDVAVENQKPIRIGVNWGSLDQDLLDEFMDANAKAEPPRDANAVLLDAVVESAIRSAELAEEYGISPDRIILSSKVSKVPDLLVVYRGLARRSNYPLHLGLTEAGMGSRGIVSSAAGLAILLQEGIGDTIRVSLTPRPGGDRAEEVRVAQQILQSLGLRQFAPQVSACPGCGRTTSSFFQQLAEDIEGHMEAKMAKWKVAFPGVEGLKVAVMGCVVNGPGESKHADIGISLPGTGEAPQAPVFVDGRHFRTLNGPAIAHDFMKILENYVQQRWGGDEEASSLRNHPSSDQA